MLDELQELVVKLDKMAKEEPFVFFSIENNLDCDHSRKNSKTNILIEGIKNYALLSFNETNTGFLVKLLKSTVFAKDKKVICCNSKPFFSFLLSKKTNLDDFECVFYDLNWWINYYFPQKNNFVKNIKDLLTNYKEELTFLTRQEKDSTPMNLYNFVFKKLITKIIPNIENTYLIDLEKEEKVYSFYEIEGQENGRLCCQVHLSKSFNPHSLNKDVKEKLVPQKPFNVFSYLDFKNMEVFVLAEISKDQKLKSVLSDKNGDFYGYVFEKLLGIKNISRNIAKKLFLGVIYGLGHHTFAKVLNTSPQEAIDIYKNLKTLFPDAFGFIDHAEKQAKDSGYVIDVFGRKKILTSQFYKAKNFVVQSPSAFLCLEKLVNLYESLDQKNVKIAYHVHDGYCLMMEKNYFLKCIKNIKMILEEESKFLPNLKLQVSIELGRNLNNMQKLIFK